MPSYRINSKELAKLCYITNMEIILGGIWGKLYCKSIIKNNRIVFPETISFSEDNIFNIHYYQKINSAVLLEDIVYNYRENEGLLTSKADKKLLLI